MEVMRTKKGVNRKQKNPEASVGSGFYFTRQAIYVRTLSTAEAASKQKAK